MRTLKQLFQLPLAILAALALVLGATACAPDQDDTTQLAQIQQAPDDPVSEQVCFAELTASQRSELRNYYDQGNVFDDGFDRDDDGVCVIDANGNTHFYTRDDDNDDYLFYLAMLTRSNTLATYGLITGDISPFEYMVLASLTSYDRHGVVYHPYSYSSHDRSWGRTPTYVGRDGRPVQSYDQARRVGSVYYGNSRTPVPYAQAKAKAPAKYRKVFRSYPKSTDQVAKVTKGSNGKYTVSTVKDQSAKQQVNKSWARPTTPANQPNSKATAPAKPKKDSIWKKKPANPPANNPVPPKTYNPPAKPKTYNPPPAPARPKTNTGGSSYNKPKSGGFGGGTSTYRRR